MKRTATLFLSLSILISATAQGFSTSSTTWGLPSGGYLYNGITYGYKAMGGTASTYDDTNSETWSTMDMDGDGRPDLVVTAQRNSNGYVQEFSPGSNSYWKVYLNNGGGFNTSPTNWSLPTGGYLYNGITYGYQALGGTASTYDDTNSETWSTVDMNGDGRPDLVVTAQRNSNGYVQEFSPGSNSYWKVYLNNGSGFDGSYTTWNLPTGGYLYNGITYGYQGLGGSASTYDDTNSETWSTVDMNGDGRPDLVVSAQRNSNGYVQEFSPGSNSYWKVYLNNGSGFDGSYTTWSLPTGGYLYNGITYGYQGLGGSASTYDDTNSETWSTVDMNGDGRPDLVVSAQRNSNGYVQEFSPGSNSYWKVYQNNGSGFDGSYTSWSLPSGGYLYNGITYGYQALGGSASTYDDTNSETWSTVDMNGDGRPDLVVTAQRNSNGYVQEFSPGSNSYWKVYQNNGSGFNTSSSTWGLPTGGYLYNGITYGYQAFGGNASTYDDTNSETWSAADMNNDGSIDLVVTAQRNSNGYVQEFSPGSNSYWKVYLGPSYVGIDEGASTPSITIAPNPGNGVFHITAGTRMDAVDVFDMVGRPVHHEGPTGISAWLDLQGLAEGSYLVKVTTGRTLAIRTLIITRNLR